MSPPSPSAALAGLNPAQKAAVNYMQGPCLVLAGAGSGKTRVITHKIGRLIEAGLEPKRIAAITSGHGGEQDRKITRRASDVCLKRVIGGRG